MNELQKTEIMKTARNKWRTISIALTVICALLACALIYVHRTETQSRADLIAAGNKAVVEAQRIMPQDIRDRYRDTTARTWHSVVDHVKWETRHISSTGEGGAFVQYLIIAVCFAGAYIVSAYAVLTPIMILRVSFPITTVIETVIPNEGLKTIKVKNWFGLLFWLIIDAAAAFLVARFAPTEYAFAALFGALACVLFSFGKTGRTIGNTFAFYQTNLKLIPEALQDEFKVLVAGTTKM